MSEKTNIEWATHTASPWFGCTEVSLGCTNCYARELTLQKKWAGWGDKSPRVRSKGFWKDAYTYNKKAICANCGYHEFIGSDDCRKCGKNFDPATRKRPRMFTSLMDWLDPKVPVEWLADFLRVIHDCQNLDWLLLTKRPEHFQGRLRLAWKVLYEAGHLDAALALDKWFGMMSIGNHPPNNVWFGVTVENQEMADKRIPVLLSIPARVRWLSVEPLLSPIDLLMAANGYDKDGYRKPFLKPLGIDWVVVGGESGSKRRDCGVEAIINVAEQCRANGVPVFVKQDFALRPGQQGRIPDDIWALKQFPSTP